MSCVEFLVKWKSWPGFVCNCCIFEKKKCNFHDIICLNFWDEAWSVFQMICPSAFFRCFLSNSRASVIGLLGWVFTNGPGDWSSIPRRVIPKTQKMPPCLTLSIMRYGSRVKWSILGNGVAPSPTPRCSSYQKGSLRVANFTFKYSCYSYLLLWLNLQHPDDFI